MILILLTGLFLTKIYCSLIKKIRNIIYKITLAFATQLHQFYVG